MADGGHDGGMSLQHDVGVFVQYVCDADGIFDLPFVSETVHFAAGIFGVCAGHRLCAALSETVEKEESGK